MIPIYVYHFYKYGIFFLNLTKIPNLMKTLLKKNIECDRIFLLVNKNS